MDNLLLKYLSGSFAETGQKSPVCGAFVTISREYGCPSREIAVLLADKLTALAAAKGRKDKWRWITKEVFEESAKELEIDPARVKMVLDDVDRGAIDNIISSFSGKYYKNDAKVRKTVAEVIRSIAMRGCMIIVGRAGVAITRDLPGGLHVRIQAPLEYRAQCVAESQGKPYPEALAVTRENDRKRTVLIEKYLRGEFHPTIFDVVFNSHHLTSGEIADTISHMLEIRKLV